MIGRRGLAAGAAATLAACAAPTARLSAQNTYRGQTQAFRVSVLSRGLENPWSVAFLPDGGALITERPGRLRRWRGDRLDPAPIGGVPEVFTEVHGGLLDVVPHPQFTRNQLIYLSYAAPVGGGGAVTQVIRARLDGDRLIDHRAIVTAGPAQRGGFHFGCRLGFLADGSLLIATGERYERERAQRLDDLAGKVLRLADDGRVPPDNPFVGRAEARPEIFSYGHRNPQGLAIHPTTGVPWLHEHGPRGGDEVNILRAGANYGWPRTTHGIDYSGAVISPHKSLPGITDPIHVWTPSIAPSGMAFCTGGIYPGWVGSLFVGALAGQVLVRLTLAGDRVTAEERLLEGEVGRIRDVRQGPDDRLYLLTDAAEGALLRLDPA